MDANLFIAYWTLNIYEIHALSDLFNTNIAYVYSISTNQVNMPFPPNLEFEEQS